jgi:hypothetical protein
LKYKWLGGAYGADGCIYGMPSDASSILRIDPMTDTAITFGHVSGKMNKFQGGVLSPKDKCVYAVPADMDCVLRIRTDPDLPVVADTVGSGLGDVDDKWQGGFLANDGKIYGIPVSTYTATRTLIFPFDSNLLILIFIMNTQGVHQLCHGTNSW